MDFTEVVKARRSVRKYTSSPLDEEAVKRIFRAFRQAPSASNKQPYKLLVIRDEDKKLKLVHACKGAKWIAEPPIVLVACAYVDEAYPTMGGYMSSYPIDVAIALDHLTLAAAAEGIGTCWIGAFSEERVKDVLDLPKDVKVVALMPMGYPAEEPEARPRKHLSELVCYEELE